MSGSPPEQRGAAEVPSVQSFQTDIDLSAADYEPQPGGPVIWSLVLTIALAVLAVVSFFLWGPLIGGAMVVPTLACAWVLVVLNRRYGAIDERNRRRFTERVDLVRPVVKEQFDFDIPADFAPVWTGKTEYQRSRVFGVITIDGRSIALSAGPSPLIVVQCFRWADAEPWWRSFSG